MKLTWQTQLRFSNSVVFLSNQKAFGYIITTKQMSQIYSVIPKKSFGWRCAITKANHFHIILISKIKKLQQIEEQFYKKIQLLNQEEFVSEFVTLILTLKLQKTYKSQLIRLQMQLLQKIQQVLLSWTKSNLKKSKEMHQL